MQLTKHHGLANDFLVALDEVNGRGLAVDGELARHVCDRRLGIGADGLIHGAAPEAGSDLTVVMHLFNADGSRAEMSGNGIRCLAHAVALAREATELHVRVGSDAGVRDIVVRSADPADQTAYVEAFMGKVRPGPEVPPAVVERLAQDGPAHALHLATSDVGNPHLVVEVADPAAVDLATDGAWIEDRFPDGINVEFIAPVASTDGTETLELRVWERGAGITRACGTGACAAASVWQGWRSGDRVSAGADGDPLVVVRMPGGDATIVLRDDGEAVLSGRVHHVATIEIPDG